MSDDTEDFLEQMGEGTASTKQCEMGVGNGNKGKTFEVRQCPKPAVGKLGTAWYCKRHYSMVRDTWAEPTQGQVTKPATMGQSLDNVADGKTRYRKTRSLGPSCW